MTTRPGELSSAPLFTPVVTGTRAHMAALAASERATSALKAAAPELYLQLDDLSPLDPAEPLAHLDEWVAAAAGTPEAAFWVGYLVACQAWRLQIRGITGREVDLDA